MFKPSKIAIVYDWIDKWGGVERLLLTLHEMFPEADFFTSYFDPEKAPWAKDLRIKTSFIQKLPMFIRRSRLASFPFYPYVFESFDFTGYDLVVSVTSSFAKSIITKSAVHHICYLLTPTRYLWVSPNNYIKNPVVRSVFSPYLAKLREWDFIAAQRPDKIISISHNVADLCRKFYRRDSEVIYPPFDLKYWSRIKSEIISKFLPIGRQSKFLNSKQKYFLVVSRLEPYKRTDFVIQLFNQLNQNLVIVGEGSEFNKLRKMSNENIFFLNKLSDKELGYLYSNSEALIMPQEEDFGYVSLEAQFFGCPVISYKKGGTSETIIEGKTGIFFDKQTTNSLKNALKKMDMIKYRLKHNTKESGEENVDRFSKEKFISKFFNYIL